MQNLRTVRLLLPFPAPYCAEVLYLIVFLTSKTMYPSPLRRISTSFPRFKIASIAFLTSSQFNTAPLSFPIAAATPQLH